MMELAGLPLDALGIGSGWALVALVVVLIYRGQLVPRRTYDDVVHDRNEWRTAHRISESARMEGESHQRVMAETATTMNQLMHEMQERLRVAKSREAGSEGSA